MSAIQMTRAEDKAELQAVKKTHCEDIGAIWTDRNTYLTDAEKKLTKQAEKLRTELDQGQLVVSPAVFEVK